VQAPIYLQAAGQQAAPQQISSRLNEAQKGRPLQTLTLQT